MNRLYMAEQIAKHWRTLQKEYKDELDDSERLRREFVARYTVSKIRNLTLEEYVIGMGSGNCSFCYRLERKMDRLGSILSSTPSKFGVYYGKRGKNDTEKKYRVAGRWGDSLEKAFDSVKETITNLLKDAERSDFIAVEKNRLSPMFKGKLLFVYHPDRFAPIYSKEHLLHFAASLDLSGAFRSEVEIQRALMEYRATWPELSSQPALLYMRLLYLMFGYPPDKKTDPSGEVELPLLDSAVAGVKFIDQMPAFDPSELNKSKRSGKIDYEFQQRQFKRIGDRGEALVVELEKRRLINQNRCDLADRIIHVSQENDRAGYDILSFDEDGTERQIEVKATTGANLSQGFYISANELEQAKALPNYYLYIVFTTISKHPRVLCLKKPDLHGNTFCLSPVVFHVTTPIKKGDS